MTKFEQRGVDSQLSSLGINDSRRRFSISCDICCRRNLPLNCDACAIRQCHLTLMSAFADEMRRQKNGNTGTWKLRVS